MIKRFVLTACLLAGVGVAHANDRGLTWNSMAMFVGKTYDAGTQSRVDTYMARIESRQADESGYYEVWTDSRTFFRESFASQVARTFRAACNATRSNTCVRDKQPAWNERLDKVIFVH